MPAPPGPAPLTRPLRERWGRRTHGRLPTIIQPDLPLPGDLGPTTVRRSPQSRCTCYCHIITAWCCCYSHRITACTHLPCTRASAERKACGHRHATKPPRLPCLGPCTHASAEGRARPTPAPHVATSLPLLSRLFPRCLCLHPRLQLTRAQEYARQVVHRTSHADAVAQGAQALQGHRGGEGGYGF